MCVCVCIIFWGCVYGILNLLGYSTLNSGLYIYIYIYVYVCKCLCMCVYVCACVYNFVCI